MKSATLDVIAGLNPEEEQEPEKKIEVERTPELERILKGFEQVLASANDLLFSDMVARFTPEQMPTATITQASIALAAYSSYIRFPDRAGRYLTALVNFSSDYEHTIFVNGYTQPPNHIGFWLDKKLVVDGPTGINTGLYNQGELILRGNSGIYTGFHNEGDIILFGNACDKAGHYNEGRISIDGSVGENFGFGNIGTIWLNGSFKSLSSDYLGKGDIYHNGKLLVRGH